MPLFKQGEPLLGSVFPS